MEMREEEHLIKMNILRIEMDNQKEKLKCSILEKEILEIKKMAEQKNFDQMYGS